MDHYIHDLVMGLVESFQNRIKIICVNLILCFLVLLCSLAVYSLCSCCHSNAVARLADRKEVLSRVGFRLYTRVKVGAEALFEHISFFFFFYTF